MTPYGIVYRDTVASLNEGANIWQKKNKIVSKKYLILSILLISALIIGVNRVILNFYDEPELYSASNMFFSAFEIASVVFLILSSLRKNLKDVFMSANSSKAVKQAVLREEDIEFSTAFNRANYFYDEIDSVVEGIYSLNIIIEKGNLPVCISKSDIAKGDIEKFTLILREKMKDRYFTERKVGGKAI